MIARDKIFGTRVIRAFAAIALCTGIAGAATADPAAKPSYDAARGDPIHFKPAIDTASNEDCLVCHREILERRPLDATSAGVKSSEVLAWYQTLNTYTGDQETLHRRHLVTPLAKSVMNLQCRFCHRGHDPREEAPGSSATAAAVGSDAGFTLRKQVDPAKTCLLCHGSFPHEIMDLEGPWHQVRADFESEELPNGCLTCHADLYRTVRHNVTYLNADAIEKAAEMSADLCYGCHGGRAWYRISYPYPRHAWPDMSEDTPDWATDRPTESDPLYRVDAE